MKKIFPFLFFVITVLQSCLIRPCEPCRPPYPPPPGGGQPWIYTPEEENNDTTENNTNDDPSGEPGICNNEQPIRVSLRINGHDSVVVIDEDFIPPYKYDSAYINDTLTFNVFLGWPVGEMETIVLLKDFPEYGGEIIFNIYTNNLSMSMYEFSKNDKYFYEFSSESPYCGYTSYSLDTKPISKYKLIVKENNTNSKRICRGYWSCNDPSGFYSKFGILLYQRF